jgi:hypothetical protein
MFFFLIALSGGFSGGLSVGVLGFSGGSKKKKIYPFFRAT